MPESDENPFGKLFRRFSKQPDKGSMNENEARADKMAVDLRAALNRAIPKPGGYGFHPIRWAVRTSMNEINSLAALDEVINELPPEALDQMSRKTGLSVDELTSRYKKRGDEVDRKQVSGAYVIAECNIDHQAMKGREATVAAANFLDITTAKVNQHKPDEVSVEVNELQALSQGFFPDKEGALFIGKYTFKSRR